MPLAMAKRIPSQPEEKPVVAAHNTRILIVQDEPHLLARMPDHDLWMTFFRDSEGNLMGLMSEVKR